jgi:predicted secreted Zn-dependent protease
MLSVTLAPAVKSTVENMAQSNLSLTFKSSLVILAFLFLSPDANAKMTHATNYNYFKIQGQTAREIYASLLKYAKGPSGHDAYATTTIQVFQKSKFAGSSPCRIQKLELKATFKINMPKLQSSGMAPQVQQSWRSFENALMTHEKHHRSLWMACVSKLERQAKTMQASNCSALSAKLKSTWKSIEAQCIAQNNAFDRSEKVALMRQPFIKLVISNRK